MDTYFSVDSDNSRRTGLPTFAASGGAKNVALGLTSSCDLARQWVVIGLVGLPRLVWGVEDSPIVKQRGDRNAVSAGMTLGYRF
ncbi:MAG: MipA/OmpV family protein [Rhodocyclaceae bacterium]|nr:MipA/OmpV family protein [Rhodocyclaceae bacterium]